MIHPMGQPNNQSINQTMNSSNPRLKPSSNRVVLSNAGSSLMSPSVKQSSNQLTARKTFINDRASPRTALDQSMRSSLASPSGRNGPFGPNRSNNQTMSPEDTPLFKASRAKKLFIEFDTNFDKKLSKQEFDTGLRSLVQSINQSNNQTNNQMSSQLGNMSLTQSSDQSNNQTINPSISDLNISFTQSINESGECLIDPLSQSQLDALFKEADYDNDQSISQAEFLWRFAGGPIPINQSAKQTLILQTIKPPIRDSTKINLDDVRTILESVYDGPKPRYKAVDLTKIEQVSNAGLKRILQQTLAAERDESVAEKRQMEEWAAHIFRCNNLTQKDVDRLFNELDKQRTGRVDLGPFFAACQLRPSRRNKKKVNGAHAGYLLTTVPAQHARDWINDLLFDFLCKNSNQTINQSINQTINQSNNQSVPPLHPGLNYPYKCHPPLPHWGDADKKKKSLDLKRGETGYKQFLFLSERTKIRAIIKKQPVVNQSINQTSNQASPSNNQPVSPTGRRTNRQRPTTQSVKSPVAQTPKSPSNQPIEQPVGFQIYVTFRTELTEFKRLEYFYHCRIDLGMNETFLSLVPVLNKSWRDGELDTINQTIKQSVTQSITDNQSINQLINQSVNQPASDESIEWTKYCGAADEEEYSIPPLGASKGED